MWIQTDSIDVAYSFIANYASSGGYKIVVQYGNYGRIASDTFIVTAVGKFSVAFANNIKNNNISIIYEIPV